MRLFEYSATSQEMRIKGRRATGDSDETGESHNVFRPLSGFVFCPFFKYIFMTLKLCMDTQTNTNKTLLIIEERQ